MAISTAKKKCLYVSQVVEFLKTVPGNTPVVTNWDDEGLLVRTVEDSAGEVVVSFEELEEETNKYPRGTIHQTDNLDDDDDLEPLGVPTLDVIEDDDDDDDY